MEYALGVLTGLFIAVLVFSIEIYLKSKNQSISGVIEKDVEKRINTKGEIILPVPDVVRSVNEKIRKNESLGLDTSLDEILKD